jgi:hypothetical protein
MSLTRGTLTDASRGLELDADDQVPAVRFRDPQAGPLILLEHQVLIGTAVDIRRGVVAAHLGATD